MSRFFGPPPAGAQPNPLDGESFISVSVRSDMDLGPAPAAQEQPASSFAGCVPQIMPTTSRGAAALAALPSKSVHKLKPGRSNLVRVPAGQDYSEDYSKLPPFSYDNVRLYHPHAVGALPSCSPDNCRACVLSSTVPSTC